MLAINNLKSIEDYVCTCGSRLDNKVKFRVNEFFHCFNCNYCVKFSTEPDMSHHIYYSIAKILVYRNKVLIEGIRYRSFTNKELEIRLINDDYYFHSNELLKKIYKLLMFK